MRARPFWTWDDDQTINQLLNGWSSGGSATLTRVAGALRVTPTAADSRIQSPLYLSLAGIDYPTLVIKVSRVSGSTWDGKVFFITDEDAVFNGTKSVTIVQPGSWVGEQTITVTMSANATWNANVIKQIRLDLGAALDDVFDINSVELVGTASGKLSERLVGLPLTEQWAVDWELRTAYDHGVDVFAVCHFQESLSGAGKHDWYLDRVAASTVTEPIKVCIIGIYQPPYNTLFTSTANIQTVAGKYSALITALGDRYWKIDGRPVIQMFSDASVASQMISSGVPSAYAGGETVPNIKTALAHFVATVRAQVLADTGMNPYIVNQRNGSFPTWFANAGPGTPTPDPVNGPYTSIIEAAGFDAATSYIQRTGHFEHTVTGGTGGGTALNWPPSDLDDALTSEQSVRSYSTMVECRDRNHSWIYETSGINIPYWPHVTVGWARYPWAERDQVTPNPEDLNWPSLVQLRANFAKAREFLDNYPEQAQGVVTIYAWDEYGEGGVLAPTKGCGYMALEAMREGLRL